MQSKTYVLSLGLALGLHAVSARAQGGPEELVRRELLNEADAARTAGDHERSLDLARRAMQIRATPSVGLIIAQEAEALSALPGRAGLALEALIAAETCAAQANLDPTLRNRDVILLRCREVALHMRPRVGRVRLTVDGATPQGTTVQVNGSNVPQTMWNVDYPVAPGRVRVDAATPDGREFHTEAEVGAGSTRVIAVIVPQRAAPEAQTAPATQTVIPRPTPATPDAPRSNVGSWALIGGGAALAITGGVLLGLRFSATDEREGICPDGACVSADALARATSAQSDAKTYNTVGFILMGAGLAAALSGVILRAIDTPRRAPRASMEGSWRWGFSAGAGGAFGALEGSL